MIEDGNAISEALYFLQGVRGEENGGGAGLKDLRFEKVAKLGGSNDVDAAGGFVQEEHARAMEQGASQADALDRAGRERADLAIQKFADSELRG